MSASNDSQPPASDIDGTEHLEEDPGEELEAMIEQADRPFASESFGTTADEQNEGEPLDQKLREERPHKPALLARQSVAHAQDQDGGTSPCPYWFAR